MRVGWKLFWDNKRSEGKTMTPKRETYMASCSKREAWIRTKMFQAQSEISLCKAILNYRHKVDDISKWKTRLETWKIEFTAYRHELHRLKGMDRVVVPRDVNVWKKTDGYELYGECCCDDDFNILFEDTNKYCSCCGRRVLWEGIEINEIN